LRSNDWGAAFVRTTLIRKLREGKVQLADKDGNMVEVPVKDLGIGYPVITSDETEVTVEEMDDPNDVPRKVEPGEPAPPPKKLTLHRYDFTLQFAWQPTPPSKRRELQEQRAKAEAGALAGADAATPAEGN
jgi:hypothetical protein